LRCNRTILRIIILLKETMKVVKKANPVNLYLNSKFFKFLLKKNPLFEFD